MEMEKSLYDFTDITFYKSVINTYTFVIPDGKSIVRNINAAHYVLIFFFFQAFKLVYPLILS